MSLPVRRRRCFKPGRARQNISCCRLPSAQPSSNTFGSDYHTGMNGRGRTGGDSNTSDSVHRAFQAADCQHTMQP
ncbi:hypothetical protein FRC12_003482 [Ceratobasidium sp. 428]|nr:hypothetical protein FRC12_003482 [Ceratobasidium sp. 428]